MSYFTMIYGVIHLPSGKGRLCQAGHPTPFIVTPAGEVTPIGSGGAPVGLMPDLNWDDVDFELRPGERLCLFSDGITECENPAGEQFGPQRLQQWLQQHVNEAIGALLPQFGQHLTGWRNGEQMADDVSLLIIERNGEK